MTWFKERLYSDFAQVHRIRRVLISKKTKFQDLEIIETPFFGRMLVLDGVVQTTQRDEFIYHEMLTHAAMFAHPSPKSVLIIGAGDGGVLREVLKYDIREAVIVEIDGEVIELSKKYLPMICRGAFDDSRVSVVIDDGARFLSGAGRKFDVILVDSPDPIGPAKILFSKKFYKAVLNSLTAKGIMARQSGAPFMQAEELKNSCVVLKSVFPKSAVYLACVPTYIGGFFSFVIGSKAIDPGRLSPAVLRRRYARLDLKTKYYNPEVHLSAFTLPNFIKDLTGRGQTNKKM